VPPAPSEPGCPHSAVAAPVVPTPATRSATPRRPVAVSAEPGTSLLDHRGDPLGPLGEVLVGVVLAQPPVRDGVLDPRLPARV
jgi:hypothetical protein